MRQRGFIHLLPLLLIIVVIVVFVLASKGIIKLPFKLPNIPFLSNQPSVSLKTEYQNPFKKESQYVNPFETYKNPFVVNR